MKIDKIAHETPVNSCTACGINHDRASMVNGEGKPSCGDITVCIDCGHIMAFTNDLTFRELTDKEIIWASGNSDIVAVNNARAKI